MYNKVKLVNEYSSCLLILLLSIFFILMTKAICSDIYDATYNKHTKYKNTDIIQRHLVKYYKIKGKKLTLWSLFIYNMKVIKL